MSRSGADRSWDTAGVTRGTTVGEGRDTGDPDVCDAVANVKNVETGNAATSTAQGVNKINGVETINGVKADGRTVVPPTKPVAPVTKASI